MSSILDALRKLEEEKAQQFSAPETPLPIEPPAREPAPRRTRSRRSTRSSKDHSRKLWLAVPAVIFALGIIWAATVMGPQSAPTSAERDLLAAATPAPVENQDQSGVAELRDPTLERIEAGLREVAETPGQAPPVVPEPSLTAPIQQAEPDPEPVAPEPEPQTNEEFEPAPTPDVEPEVVPANVAPIQVDVKPIPMEVVEEPEELVIEEPPIVAESEPIEPEPVPAEPFEPEPEPVVEEIAPPRTEPSERYRNAMAVSNALRGETTEPEEPAEPVEQDIRRYDIMTRTVRARLGIPELVINMLGLPNERQPNPSALINYNNVYVGEPIPDTQGRVHLIGVDIRGIAVEVEGERFYYPK